MQDRSGVENEIGVGFRFVPTVVTGRAANGEFVGAAENTGRAGVSKMFDTCFTGVRSGIGEDDGGKSVRVLDGDCGARKSASSSSVSKRLDLGRTGLVSLSDTSLYDAMGDENTSSSSTEQTGRLRRFIGEVFIRGDRCFGGLVGNLGGVWYSVTGRRTGEPFWSRRRGLWATYSVEENMIVRYKRE